MVIQTVEQNAEDDLQVEERIELMTTLPQVSSGWPQEEVLVVCGRPGGPDALAAILGARWSKQQNVGQRRLAVIRRDSGTYFVPEVSFRVVDISRTNIPSAQGAVMSAAYRSYEAARAALERLLGYSLPQEQGLGWSHGRCAWFEGRKRVILTER